ncbi:MAG: UDP-2,3-diacylglucosamine diphosphatase LpxI [Candidatus Omnitrophota bacterium]
MRRIGLIAGNRRFPLCFAQAARKNGCSVVAAAIKGEASPQLRRYVDKIYWLGLNEFQRLLEIFKKEGINEVVMAGQISPRRLFSKEVTGSKELAALLSGIKDKKADTIFGAIAQSLSDSGLKLLSSTIFMEDFLPKKATLTKREPDLSTWEDIYFGLELAKAIALLDIGQSVAVKHKAIVAVEALEGTDNLIRRAGKISGGDFSLIKVSKPKQDARFDIPVVGLGTIKILARSGAKCLAFEAGKALFLDREQAVALADKKGLAVVAL